MELIQRIGEPILFCSLKFDSRIAAGYNGDKLFDDF